MYQINKYKDKCRSACLKNVNVSPHGFHPNYVNEWLPVETVGIPKTLHNRKKKKKKKPIPLLPKTSACSCHVKLCQADWEFSELE